MNTAFIARTLVNAASLWVAVSLVPGVEFSGGWLAFLGVALVFGVLNAVLGPVMKILSLPLIVVTFGIFLLVINAFLLWLTSRLSLALGLGFAVSGFWSAFWGGLVVSVVSALLGLVIAEPRQVVIIRR
jgi:putative membrane protein